MEQSDHDLLIALNTKMEMLLSGQQHFIQQWGKLLERVTSIEIQQGKHSAELADIQEELNSLKKKSTIVDTINAIFAGVAGVVGFFFGQK